VVALATVALAASCGSDGDAGGGGGGDDEGSAEPSVELVDLDPPDGFDPFPGGVNATAPDGMLYLEGSGSEDVIIAAVRTDDEVVVVDLTEALVGQDELAPGIARVTTCGTTVVASVVASDGAELRAVDVESAESLWERPVVDGAEGSTDAGQLACTDDTVIAATDDLVVAISAREGTTRWSAPVEPFDLPHAAGGLVAIGTFEDGVIGLDVETGEERWRIAEGDFMASISEHGATIESSDSLLVVTPDGDVVAEIDQERFEELPDPTTFEQLDIVGPPDQLVLIRPGEPWYVDLSGEQVDLTVDGAVVDEINGASNDLFWVTLSREVEFSTEPSVALVDRDGEIVAEAEATSTVALADATETFGLGPSTVAVFNP
jgi:hypothetical protein